MVHMQSPSLLMVRPLASVKQKSHQGSFDSIQRIDLKGFAREDARASKKKKLTEEGPQYYSTVSGEFFFFFFFFRGEMRGKQKHGVLFKTYFFSG